MAPLSGGVGLLERALGYTLGGLSAVTPEVMSRPTPCRGWDLHALLRHVTDSLAALDEAIDHGRVAMDVATEMVATRPIEGGLGGDADPARALEPVTTSRDHIRRVLGSWVGAGDEDRLITVGGCPMQAAVVACAGAIEIAVHGWDIYQACGRPRQIPPALAAELLEISPMLVTDAERPFQFAAPVTVSPAASAGDRLIAFLGRDPH